ncbi:MAG: phosphoglycerate kinase [Patescibacteria group bacterium]
MIVRVDWNVPMEERKGKPSEKILREIPFLRSLHERGAIVLLLTHLGRPEGREKKYSTQPLAAIARFASKLPIRYQDIDFSTPAGAKKFVTAMSKLKAGDIVLGENVRFQPGEEKNVPSLVAQYAKWGKVFINDAFASSHRAHASVVGLAKALPSYAGPNLNEEVTALTPLLKPKKRPYLAFIGGSKLSTKLPVIQQLLKVADRVYIGGAMAHPFFVAKKIDIDDSYIEKEGIPLARKLLRLTKKIVLPKDVIVAKKIAKGIHPHQVDLEGIGKHEAIGDVGMGTIQSWGDDIKKAGTIVWNGPLGVTEIPAFSHSSLVLAKAIALRTKHGAYTVAGGGDTLPVIDQSGMGDLFSHVSTGGGAMLEFLSENGKLPGITILSGKQKSSK